MSPSRGEIPDFFDQFDKKPKKKRSFKKFFRDNWFYFMLFGLIVFAILVGYQVFSEASIDKNKKVSDMTVSELYTFGFFVAIMAGVFGGRS